MSPDIEILHLSYELEARFKALRSLSSELRRFGLEGYSQTLNMELELSWLDGATKDNVISLFESLDKR